MSVNYRNEPVPLRVRDPTRTLRWCVPLVTCRKCDLNIWRADPNFNVQR